MADGEAARRGSTGARGFLRASLLVLASACGGPSACSAPHAIGRAVPPGAPVPGEGDLESILEPIREGADLPALAGAIVTETGAVHLGVTGVRKAGDPTPALLGDPFHLGSDTKAMTALVVGKAVDEGKLTFATRLDEVFPEWVGQIDPAYAAVTVDQLLAHRAGFPRDGAMLGPLAYAPPDDAHLASSRAEWVKDALRKPPHHAPGTAWRYSNLGYVTVAAMVERRTGTAWEELVVRDVFAPLGMTGYGFGAAGHQDKVDAPWPHAVLFESMPWRVRIPLPPSRFADNPWVIDPAGRVHLPMEAWARFVADQLASFEGRGKLVRPGTYEHLHTPLFGGDYAGGWGTAQRSWAGGTAFTHAGSNVRNFAVAWLAPARHFAVLVATNQGDARAQKACDDAAGALIRKHEEEGSN